MADSLVEGSWAADRTVVGSLAEDNCVVDSPAGAVDTAGVVVAKIAVPDSALEAGRSAAAAVHLPS